MEAIVPTTIGGKVLATAENGERFAILETEIVTPAIGDIDLAIPATSWTGQAITRISQPTDFAAVGSREENAKNAALPEPVTIEARIIIPHITKSMIRPPVPSMEAAALMIVVIPPVNFKPSAKTPAQIISATVEVNTLPIPEKKDFMLSQDFLKSRV